METALANTNHSNPVNTFKNLAKLAFRKNGGQREKRKKIAAESLHKIQNGNTNRPIESLFDDIDDGLLENLLDLDELGLTEENWKMLCRKHNYKPLAQRYGEEIKKFLENPEKNNISIETLEECESLLQKGVATLEDLGITPKEWTRICGIKKFHSQYQFNFAPEIFGNPKYVEKYPLDEKGGKYEKYELEIIVHGGYEIPPPENQPVACLEYQTNILKNNSYSGKQKIFSGKTNEKVTPGQLAEQVREIAKTSAVGMLERAGFLPELLQ